MRLRLILAALAAIVAVLPSQAFAGWEHMAGRTVIADFDFEHVGNSNYFGRIAWTCRMELHAYVSREGNLFYSEIRKSCSGENTMPGSAEQGYVFALEERSGTIDLLGGPMRYKVGSTASGFKLDLTYTFAPIGDIIDQKGKGTGLIEVSVDGGGCKMKRTFKSDKTTRYGENLERDKVTETYKLRSCRIVEGKQ